MLEVKLTGIESARLSINAKDSACIGAELSITFSNETKKSHFKKFIKQNRKPDIFYHLSDDHIFPNTVTIYFSVGRNKGIAKLREHNVIGLLNFLTENTDFDFNNLTEGRYVSCQYDKTQLLSNVFPFPLFFGVAAIANFWVAGVTTATTFLLQSGRNRFKEQSLAYFEQKTSSFSVTQNEKKGILCGLDAAESMKAQFMSTFNPRAYNKEFLTGYYGVLAAKENNRNPALVEKIQSIVNFKKIR